MDEKLGFLKASLTPFDLGIWLESAMEEIGKDDEDFEDYIAFLTNNGIVHGFIFLAGGDNEGIPDPVHNRNVFINFTGPEDETINLGVVSNLAQGGSLVINVDDGYNSYAWFINGVRVQGAIASSLTISGDQLNNSANTITVVVTKWGIPYSKVILVTK
jgi:hypothetical protein